MSERENAKEKRVDRKNSAEEAEKRRGVVIVSQIVALILCFAVSVVVWLVVHYREDKKTASETASYVTVSDTADYAGSSSTL